MQPSQQCGRILTQQPASQLPGALGAGMQSKLPQRSFTQPLDTLASSPSGYAVYGQPGDTVGYGIPGSSGIASASSMGRGVLGSEGDKGKGKDKAKGKKKEGFLGKAWKLFFGGIKLTM